MLTQRRKDLETAHLAIPERDRRIAKFKDGTQKSFIDLKIGDVFHFILADGSVDYVRTGDGKKVTWVKCTEAPYLNNHRIPTIKMDFLPDQI